MVIEFPSGRAYDVRREGWRRVEGNHACADNKCRKCGKCFVCEECECPAPKR